MSAVELGSRFAFAALFTPKVEPVSAGGNGRAVASVVTLASSLAGRVHAEADGGGPDSAALRSFLLTHPNVLTHLVRKNVTDRELGLLGRATVAYAPCVRPIDLRLLKALSDAEPTSDTCKEREQVQYALSVAAPGFCGGDRHFYPSLVGALGKLLDATLADPREAVILVGHYDACDDTMQDAPLEVTESGAPVLLAPRRIGSKAIDSWYAFNAVIEQFAQERVARAARLGMRMKTHAVMHRLCHHTPPGYSTRYVVSRLLPGAVIPSPLTSLHPHAIPFVEDGFHGLYKDFNSARAMAQWRTGADRGGAPGAYVYVICAREEEMAHFERHGVAPASACAGAVRILPVFAPRVEGGILFPLPAINPTARFWTAAQEESLAS